jgi:hypothetical protein
MTQLQPFPISLFDSVKNARVVDCMNVFYDEFVEVMESYSVEIFASKESAPLICSTRFEHGKRSKLNTTVSGLIILDIDDGISIESTLVALNELAVAGLLYTTASHRESHHKFRLCIPLENPVNYAEHVTCWHSINHIFTGQVADSTKIGCESLFYVAGQYPDAPSVFTPVEGSILTADEWIEIADLPPPEPRTFNVSNKKDALSTVNAH